MSNGAPKQWSQVAPWVTATVLAAVLPTLILSYLHLKSGGPKDSPRPAPAVAPTFVPAPEVHSNPRVGWVGPIPASAPTFVPGTEFQTGPRVGWVGSAPVVGPTFVPAPVPPYSARSIVYPGKTHLEGFHDAPHPPSSARPIMCIK